MINRYLFTSESVTEGHPDKVCDRISDAVLEEALSQDPDSRVAVETVASGNNIYIVGEVRTTAHLDVIGIARQTLRDIGYEARFNLDPETVNIHDGIIAQSPDIANGVDHALEVRDDDGDVDFLDVLGAGDQGIMFGYATAETDDRINLASLLAHRLAARHATVRKNGDLPDLGPDAKTQVTLEYADGKPVRIDTILISTQHAEWYDQDNLKNDVIRHIILPVLNEYARDLLPPHALIAGNPSSWSAYYGDLIRRILVNPSGRFVLGGPAADAGLTGRKIIVDTYGGAARHGGGAFSGKDPSKVDRSAAYAARWVAKSIVDTGLAHEVEVQLAYAIGSSHPVSLMVRTTGSEIPDSIWSEVVSQVFDLRPAAIIRDLDLLRTPYSHTSAYGHFGRNGFTWENTTEKSKDLQDILRRRRAEVGSTHPYGIDYPGEEETVSSAPRPHVISAEQIPTA